MSAQMSVIELSMSKITEVTRMKDILHDEAFQDEKGSYRLQIKFLSWVAFAFGKNPYRVSHLTPQLPLPASSLPSLIPTSPLTPNVDAKLIRDHLI